MPDLRTLLREAAAPPSGPLDERVLHARVRQRARRRQVARGATVLALTAALVAVGLAVREDGTGVEVDSGPASRPPSRHLEVTGWDRLPRGPVDERVGPVRVWTGSEIIVWGGEQPAETYRHNTGAAYRPETGVWRALAPSPLSARSAAAAVWTGEEVIICCGQGSQAPVATGAAYDPGRDAWREIPRSPLDDATYAAAAWTGTEMIVVGGASDAAATSEGVAYDPVSDTWRSIARAPGRIERNADVAWTGDRLIVWPRFFTSSPGLSYDPEADTWERLPPVPDDIRPDIGSMVWTGEELLVWGVAARDEDDATGARYDLDSRSWRPLADDPLPPFEWFEGTPGSQAAVWTGAEMVVYTGALGGVEGGAGARVIAYDPTADRWRELAAAPGGGFHPDLVSTGRQLYILGGGAALASRPPATTSPPPDAAPSAQHSSISGPAVTKALTGSSSSSREKYRAVGT